MKLNSYSNNKLFQLGRADRHSHQKVKKQPPTIGRTPLASDEGGLLQQVTFSAWLLLLLLLPLLTPLLALGQQMEVSERDEEGQAIKFDFNLTSGDLRGLIRFIGEETDFTIIAAEEDIRDRKFALTNLKSVTIEETLEKIKTVLSQYNLTMIKTDGTLLITTFEKAVQMKVPVTRIPPDPELVSESDEIQTYVIELTTAQASQLEKSIKPLLNKSAVIFADDFSNVLVITDVSSNVRRVASILQSIDDSEINPILVEIVPVVNAEASDIAQTIDRIFRRDREQARRVWDKLDREDVTRQGGTGPINMINGPVEIQAEESSNSLLIKGTAENIAAIKKIIERLDTAPSIQSEVKIFRLNYAIAEDVVETLEDIFEGITGSGSSRGRGRDDWRRRSRDRGRRDRSGGNQQGIVGEISIASDERLNAVVVSSDPRNFSFIETIITELDEADPQDELEIYYLKFADAEQLAEDLADLFEGGNAGSDDDWRPWWDRGRGRDRGGEESGGGFGVQGNVNIVPELRLNALLVSPSQQNFATIDKLIKDLDVSMPDQEWGTRIYKLKYADAANVQSIIDGVYQGSSGGGGGRFWFLQQQGNQSQGSLAGNVVAEAYPTLNSIIISTSTARNFKLIEQFINEIDVPSPSGQREVTRLYKLEYTDAEEMNELLERVWDEGSGFQGSGRGSMERGWQRIEAQRMGLSQMQVDVTSLNGRVEIEADTQTNSLIIQTLERYLPDVEAMIKQLDFIRGQVLIQIEILEVTLDEDTKLGLELTATEKGIFGQKLTDDNPLIGSVQSTLGLAGEISGFNYALATNEYLALLHTLMRENRVKTLSTPSLLTRDNQPVSWSSGKSIPYLQSVNSTNLGLGGIGEAGTVSQPLYNYGFIEPPIGINIDLIPHIARTKTGEDGKRTIGLEIDQITASNFIEFTDFNAPITETNTISAYVDVEDGEKVVVGGMMRETQQEVESKVPILGDIPFIGRLFRKSQKVAENSEIVFIITPHIIDVTDPADLHKLYEETEKWQLNGNSSSFGSPSTDTSGEKPRPAEDK